MAQEQRYPHVEIREESDSPNPIRVVQNRTIIMVSTSHRGFHKKATVVNSDNYDLVVGKTAHVGSRALEAMFDTFDPSRVLLRRVLADARVAKSGTAEGFKFTGTATAIGSVDLVIDPDGAGATASYTVSIPVASGDTAVDVATAVVAALAAQVAPNDHLVGSLDLSDATHVNLEFNAPGAVGNSLTYGITQGTLPAGLTATPSAATPLSLSGGADAPKQATAEFPTTAANLPADPKWVLVANFHGTNGNELNGKAYPATKPGATFSLDLIDDFLNKTTRFTNVQPVASDFQNDGLGFGYKFLKLQSDLVTLYYTGDPTAAIAAPYGIGTAPVTVALASGYDGAALTDADFVREIDASAEDEGTIVFCPDKQTGPIKAALMGQAIQATELSGLRQAVVQMPFGWSQADLDTDYATYNNNDGLVVSVVSWHTGVWRPELPPFSYSGDMFVAAAMATKPLQLSLADRESVPAVTGLQDTNVKSRDVDELNKIQDTGHEAIVFDPGTRAYQFLTGRALCPDTSEWSRANNRQLENQFRTDLYFMLQRYKSRPTAGMLKSLVQQVDNYFSFWLNIAQAITSVKATVGNKSNNPDARVQAGWARVDAFWAPLQFADNIECVIHTYLDTGL